MRCLTSSVLVLVFLGALGLRDASAADPADGKIRVLLTYAGHDFEEKPFYAMFDALPDVVWDKAAMPAAADLLKPGLEKKYDVVVMYDMVSGITPEQQKGFVDLLNTGIGLVSLHHNIGANQEWKEFWKILGGIHIPKVFTVDGKEYGPSGSIDDQTVPVHVADPNHPITAGVKDFTIFDETYHKYYVSPDVHVLLTTTHPDNVPQLAWCHDYGKSRVFYLMLGHGPSAWTNPNYPKLLSNGIHWAAGR